MATVISNDFRNAMLGNPTHSVIDFDTDNIDVSLLDQTDSGTISATTHRAISSGVCAPRSRPAGAITRSRSPGP